MLLCQSVHEQICCLRQCADRRLYLQGSPFVAFTVQTRRIDLVEDHQAQKENLHVQQRPHRFQVSGVLLRLWHSQGDWPKFLLPGCL